MELIVQPDAHDVEVGTATHMKHETSIALSVRCQKPIETYRQPFCTHGSNAIPGFVVPWFAQVDLLASENG